MPVALSDDDLLRPHAGYAEHRRDSYNGCRSSPHNFETWLAPVEAHKMAEFVCVCVCVCVAPGCWKHVRFHIVECNGHVVL